MAGAGSPQRETPWRNHGDVRRKKNGSETYAGGRCEEAILFSIHDTPVFEALGLYHEEAYGEHGGHQPVTSVFDG